MSLRQHVKRGIEHGLLASGIPSLSRWRRRGDVLILAYHNIVPHGERHSGDRSLHLPQENFAAQLDFLRSTYDVISLEEALARGARSAGRASIAITFDDAYQGAVTAGIAELAQRKLSATIFVPPAFLNGGVFWWDALTPPSADEIPSEVRDRALTQWGGKGAIILAKESTISLDTIPDHSRGASRDELHRAIAVPGITLGSHTWSHPNLATLSENEFDDELRRPLAWLAQHFGSVVPYLTYPYGLYSLAVERAARAAGYHAALRVDGGWLPRLRENPFALPRLNVPAGISLAGFQLRCAGVLA